MLKRDELKGPSCLTAAADDEPVFVLRANDELAPDVVRYWAERYYATKNSYGESTMSEKQFGKIQNALLTINQMDLWRQRKGSR